MIDGIQYTTVQGPATNDNECERSRSKRRILTIKDQFLSAQN
jgi:hypothetical protein